MSQLLGALARFATRHPWRLLGLAITPMLAIATVSLRVPIDLSFTGIMDRGHPEVKRYFDAVDRYQLGGTLMVLLEGDERSLDSAVEQFAEELGDHPEIAAILGPVERDWLESQLPWVVDREVFDRWVTAVVDPPTTETVTELARGFARLHEETKTVSGARIVRIRLRQNPLDVEFGGTPYFAIEERVHRAASAAGVTASLSGLPAVAAQDQSRTLGTIRRLTPISLLVVLLLFRVVERRLTGLPVIGLPLILAVGGTFGAVGLLTGSLTIMETFFGVTVFGLGIDFAVHLLARLREERSDGLPFDQALERTLTTCGPGVVAGGLTTAGAFLIIALAPDPVARHLGLAGGIGLLFCLALMLTVAPAGWVLLERFKPAEVSHRHAPLPIPLLPRIARHATERPWLYVLLTALVLTAALLGSPRFTTETNLQKVFNRQVPALQTVERIQELFGLNGAPWITSSADLEGARGLTEQFAAHPLFTRAESAALFFPADLVARHRKLLEIEPLVGQRLGQLQSIAAITGATATIEPLVRGLEILQSAARQDLPTLEGLPESLRYQWIAPDGELLVYAWAEQSPLDGRQARAQRVAAQAISPRATSLGSLLEVIMVGERPWIWPVLFGILALVGTILLVDFRDPRLALLALVPVAIGTAVTFGLLCWLDMSFNVMTVMVVPLLLGLGVDDGIHVVHRIAETSDESIAMAAASVGRAIVMTTATTVSSFAVLLFTDHPGLESMALVMLIGLPLCLAASVTTLPALAQLILRRPR